ncbi:uncharacterized protein EDC14_101952 [Hydrogenispora ethanolica]|uniref:HD/PDEase domain-containing protein n=2 Tax=Hydrogenispora ethanolica TaxID=1082276 RepID=A0A4R1REF2_HYDET|nr:uncharacterized protein EDC14_101952 [Hydrogenispora ethanolica]
MKYYDYDWGSIMRLVQPLPEYFQLARQLYQTGPAHDFSHIERVFRLALKIGAAENANLQILGLAALFHDLARDEEAASQGMICHAAASAERTRRILLSRGMNPAVVEAVCDCIATHRYRDEHKPETLEAKCLFDADKLDSLGAVGVARAYLWLGERGGTVYVPRQVWERTDFRSNRPEDDSLQREWFIKLQYLKDNLYTETARALAEKRHRTMEAFLEILAREVVGEE